MIFIFKNYFLKRQCRDCANDIEMMGLTGGRELLFAHKFIF
jgi:hypothetical protein